MVLFCQVLSNTPKLLMGRLRCGAMVSHHTLPWACRKVAMSGFSQSQSGRWKGGPCFTSRGLHKRRKDCRVRLLKCSGPALQHPAEPAVCFWVSTSQLVGHIESQCCHPSFTCCIQARPSVAQELMAELEQHQHTAEHEEKPHADGQDMGPATSPPSTSPMKRSRAAVQQEEAAGPGEEDTEQESTPVGILARAKAGGKSKGQTPAKGASPQSKGKGEQPELQAADASKDAAEDDGEVEVPDRGKAPAGRPGKRKPAAEAGTDQDPSKAMYDQSPKPKKPRQKQ